MTISQEGDTQEQPQQDSVREDNLWDVTVPLLQPAPLILEPVIQNKCKLSALRPNSSLRKGVKVSMPGSTILRRKLGDHSSARIVPLSSQQPSRSVMHQPCVLARPQGQTENFPQHQKTWCRLKVSRSRISGSLKSKITPGKGGHFPLASYVLNPPGTRPKPATTFPHKDLISPIKDGLWKPSVFRRAWADMSDSSEEEPLTCEMPPPPEAASNSGRHALTGLSKRAYKRLRQYAFWKVRKGNRQQHPKDPNSCGKSASDLPRVGPSNDSLSCLRSVYESASQQGNRAHVNVADSVAEGQAPGEPQDNEPVSRCILNAVWSRVAVRGIGYSVSSQSSLANPLQHTTSNCRDPAVSPTQAARVCARGRSPTSRIVALNPKPVFSERHTEPHTPRALSFRSEPMRGPTPGGFQVSTSFGSGLLACPQTGEYQIQQAVPPERVCLRTCSGPRNTMVSRPETANCRSDFHTPRSRSLGSSLPLVFQFNSSGGPRRCDCKLGPQERSSPTRAKSFQLLPRISQHAPARSQPTYPAGAGGGVPAVMVFRKLLAHLSMSFGMFQRVLIPL